MKKYLCIDPLLKTSFHRGAAPIVHQERTDERQVVQVEYNVKCARSLRQMIDSSQSDKPIYSKVVQRFD